MNVADALLLAKTRLIVDEEWQALIKKYELRPGSISEELVNKILNRLVALSK